MVKYVSFKPGDGTPQFVCPRCKKPFSSVSPPRNMPCGHIECESCRKRRSDRGEDETPCCKKRVNRYSRFTYTNHTLTELARQINSSNRSFTDDKVMCMDCDARHTRDDLLSCSCCNMAHLCFPCLFENHNGHGWYKNDVHAEYRDHHKSTDHTLFPDRRELNVNGQSFVVSATLLSMHSPFFDNLFFGSPEASNTSQFSLDADPKVFGDLLDMIYPWEHQQRVYDCGYNSYHGYWDERLDRSHKCCEECTLTLHDRFKMMIRFEFTNLLHRLSHVYRMKDKMELYASLNDDWSAFGKYVLPYFKDYSSFFSSLQYKGDGKINTASFKRFFDGNHTHLTAIPRLTPKLHCPDSRVLLFDGLPVVVPASVLCLSAGGLIPFFYGEENRDKRVIEFDLCTRETFDLFVSTALGAYPARKELNGSFIKFCRLIDARFAFQYYYSRL